MAKLTRRGLIKNASIGVGATGVLAVAVAGGMKFESNTGAHADAAKVSASSPTVIYMSGNNAIVYRGESRTTMTLAQLRGSM